MRVALVCFLSVGAFGQFATTNFEIHGDTMTVRLSNPMLFARPAVAGNPYSAEHVSERVQTLAGGTHITQRQNGQKVWRDSQGRTRTERELGPEPRANDHGVFTLTEINDPVGGVFYVLDDQNQVAHRLVLAASPGRQVMPRTPTRIHVSCQPQNAQAARPQCASDELPPQNIEGVTAEGWRTTETIPRGVAGNDRPLVTTDETWYSPELEMTVLSKHSDPRAGETIARWIRISRVDPDLSMFTPPANYLVVDEKDSITVTLTRR
jgi:hypothetical protein